VKESGTVGSPGEAVKIRRWTGIARKDTLTVPVRD